MTRGHKIIFQHSETVQKSLPDDTKCQRRKFGTIRVLVRIHIVKQIIDFFVPVLAFSPSKSMIIRIFEQIETNLLFSRSLTSSPIQPGQVIHPETQYENKKVMYSFLSLVTRLLIFKSKFCVFFPMITIFRQCSRVFILSLAALGFFYLTNQNEINNKYIFQLL